MEKDTLNDSSKKEYYKNLNNKINNNNHNKRKEKFSEYSKPELNLDYLFILDFEATCWNNEAAITPENPKLSIFEIIEFPVLALNVKTKIIDFKFHHYIKPKVHPKLTAFCTELTGITQDTVDKAIYLEEAFKLFEDFLIINKLNEKNFLFVTCGDWDLKTCIRNECKYKNLEYPKYFKQWVNIKKVFADYKEDPKFKVGMVGMLNDLNMKLDGKHHSGIDDCHNISKIAVFLLEKNINFTKCIGKYE